MKRLRWQLIIAILALTAIGILLIGQQPVEETPEDIVIEGFSTPVPVTGGNYTEGLIGEPGRLNPVLDFQNPVDQDIDRLLYSSLIRFDDRGLPQPDLAESWGISQDGTVYNFSLAPSARWHDGEPVTADDVVFSIQLLRSSELPIPEDLRKFWRDIEVIALDDSLVTFRLPEPYAPFLDYLTFGILPDHLLGEVEPENLIDASFNLSPVGSGPYQFSEFISEQGRIKGVVLAAFDDFYKGRPFIDEVIFRYYDDADAAITAFQAGEITGISHLTGKALDVALKEPGLNLYSGRLPQMMMILINNDNPEVPFLGEVEIRKALLRGINRQRIIDSVLGSQAIVADSPIIPGTWAYVPSLEDFSFNPETAVEALRLAEYTIPVAGGTVRARDGDFLRFELMYPEGEVYEALAEAIQEYWAAIGVAVTIVGVPYDNLVNEHLVNKTYQAALVDLNLARAPDPDPYPFWHQAQINGGQNYAQWDDRPASEFLEQARITLDIEERGRLYRNFQVRFSRELPSLPLFFPVYTYGVSADVQGVRVGPLFSPSDRLMNVQKWFLDASPTGDN